MSSAAGASGAASNAKVQTGDPAVPEKIRAQRDLYAAEAEQAVETIEAKIAGLQESLKAAKSEAKRLRAEANEE
jgi:hypothetical protein